MNTTTNYKLCQWDPDDRILRTDFNADNAKIDAALAAVPYVRLRTTTAGASAAQVSMDVSDIDFTQYQKLDLFFRSNLAGATVQFFLNNVTIPEYYPIGSSSGGTISGDQLTGSLMTLSSASGMPMAAHLELDTPMMSGNVLCKYSNISINAALGFTSVKSALAASFSITWDKLKTLDFQAISGTFPIGTEIALYGVKR